MNLGEISPFVFGLIVLYLLSRTIGKMSGAFMGAAISKAPQTVRKYLPFCLFSQAGVAIGLSLVAAHYLPEDMGNMFIMVITTTTLVVQLIGPSCVKYAVTKAGEVGRNVTEEDILKNIQIKEFIHSDFPLIKENASLDKILNLFSDFPYFYYAVINDEHKLMGIISIDSVRQIFMNKGDVNDFILATDILEPINVKIASSATANDAKVLFDQYHIGFIQVVDQNDCVIGGIEERMSHRFIARKQLEIEQSGS